MNSAVSAILDGLTAVEMHGRLVSGILLLAAVSQFLLYSRFKKIFGDKLTAGEYYTLSIGGWLLPASLISIIWYVSATIVPLQPVALLTTITVLTTVFFLLARLPKGMPAASRAMIPFLLFISVFFIILRLAYTSKIVLPMYFDSAQHYRYIRDMLSSLERSDAGITSLANYYHLGFHFLTTFITSATHAEITDAMLVLGQIILAIMPLPLFFIVRHVTRSNSAGLFSVALAAFGWYMPAHAVDWGKYPALAGLALLPFVLSLAYLRNRYKGILSGSPLRTLNAALLLGILVNVFLHSRIIVILGILALTWALQSVWHKRPGRLRLFFLSAAILVLVVEVIYIQRQGILGPLFDPYGMKAVLITACVFLLAVFAYLAYPGLVFSCIVSSSFLLASLFIPLVDMIPGFTATSLLDRPFVEMILYLPLALLGGFGLAALENTLGNKKWTWGITGFAPGRYMGALFIALVAVNAFFKYDLYPSDCCDIASEDDLAAIHWMDKNLPGDSHILVASTELKVLPTDNFQGSAGGDAGTWITPLIHRVSIFMPFNTDFSQPQILDDLCRMQVDYIYVGGTGWGFDASGMSTQPDGYKLIFQKSKSKVFEVTGCD